MIDALIPIVLSIVKALFIPLDFALGWVTVFGLIGALIVVGALTGLAVNLFQKYCSDQQQLGRRRADIEKLKQLSREAKQANDSEKVARLSSLTSQISSKYALESMKPALFSVPPMCILAMWVGARLSFEPVRPGDVIEVVASFEDGASGFTHVVPSDGLVPEGPAIVPIGIQKSTSGEALNAMQAQWKICAKKEGSHALTIRHGDERYSIPVPIFAKGGRAPEQVTDVNSQSPTRDQLLKVELKLREPVPAAWWNMRMPSMGIYLIAAILFSLALRRIMGIQ